MDSSYSQKHYLIVFGLIFSSFLFFFGFFLGIVVFNDLIFDNPFIFIILFFGMFFSISFIIIIGTMYLQKSSKQEKIEEITKKRLIYKDFSQKSLSALLLKKRQRNSIQEQKYCRFCGTEVFNEDIFCLICGEKLS